MLRDPHLLGPRGEGVRGQGQAGLLRLLTFPSVAWAQGDLKTSAQVQFRYSAAWLWVEEMRALGVVISSLHFSAAQVLNHPLDELDASYCFLWGHCQNEEVTSRTTREEAIEMCCSPELSRAS